MIRSSSPLTMLLSRHTRRSKLTVTLSPRPCRGSGWETKLLWQIKRIGLRPTNFLMKQFFCGDQMLAKRVNCFLVYLECN